MSRSRARESEDGGRDRDADHECDRRDAHDGLAGGPLRGPLEAGALEAAGAPIGRQYLDGRDWFRDPLHPLDAPFAVLDLVDRPGELDHGLGRERLSGPRQRAETRREVERAAAIPLADRDSLAGVEPDPDSERKLRCDDPCLQLDRGAYGLSCRVEDDERLVAAQLDQPAVALLDDLAHDLGEPGCERRRRLVPALVRVARVAADVGDQERADSRNSAADPVRDLGRRRLHGLGRLRDELGAGREAVVRSLGERLLDHAVDRLRQVGPEARDERRRLFQMREHDLEVALALERRNAGEALEEHAPECVDVGPGIDGAALDLFRRDVRDRSHEGLAGQARDRRRVAREAEIAEVGVLGLAGADQDVRRLDVAVDEPEPVSRVERVADLGEQVERALVADAIARVDELPKVVAFDVLHRQEEDVALLAGGIDRDDVRVLQARGQLGLEEEPTPKTLVPGQLRPDHLDGDLALQVLVLREVDGAHRAPPEQALDPETGERRPQRDLDTHRYISRNVALRESGTVHP